MSRNQYWIAVPHHTFPSGEAFYMEDSQERVYWGRWRNEISCSVNIVNARKMLERALTHNSQAYIVKYETTIKRTVVQ